MIVGLIAFFILHRKFSSHRIPIVIAWGLWILPIISYQRVVPPFRIWLFALPPTIIFITAGWFGVLGLTKLKVIIRREGTIPWIIIGVTILLSNTVITSHSVLNSNVTGVLPEAEEITIYIRDEIPSDFLVYGVGPSFFPLIYYFRKYNLENRIDEIWDGETYNEMIIVANLAHFQTTDILFDEINIPKDAYSVDYQLIREFETAEIYELAIIER